MLYIKDLYSLVKAVKNEISDDYLAFEMDEVPGIQLTVGYDPKKKTWSFQTGDNSFTGAAYHYPIWAVVGVYRDTNCMDTAREIKRQIEDQIYEEE